MRHSCKNFILMLEHHLVSLFKFCCLDQFLEAIIYYRNIVHLSAQNVRKKVIKKEIA